MILNKKLTNYVESMACKKRKGEKANLIGNIKLANGSYIKNTITKRSY